MSIPKRYPHKSVVRHASKITDIVCFEPAALKCLIDLLLEVEEDSKYDHITRSDVYQSMIARSLDSVQEVR